MGLYVEAQVEEPCVGGKFATAPPGVKCSDGEVRMITVDVASEGYKPLPWDDDTLSAAQKLQHAGCSIVSSFTDFDGRAKRARCFSGRLWRHRQLLGDYGDYTTDIILGVSFRFLSATYTPDPVDPQSGGTIKIVFQDSVLDSILAENAPAAWTVGSSICLFAEPSWIAIENANDLAEKDAIIREIDLEAAQYLGQRPAGGPEHENVPACWKKCICQRVYLCCECL